MGLTTSLVISVQLAAAAALPKPPALTCRDLPSVFGSFNNSHYAVKKIDPLIERRAAEQFIRMIDPSRTLLLASDVEKLRASVITVFSSSRGGRCEALSDAWSLVVARAEEDERLVRKILSKDYALDESVELILDADERGYAKTAEERAALVTKMVHFQMSNFLIAGLDTDKAKKQLAHRYELTVKRLRENEDGELPNMFADAFATALDPHSQFLSAETLADFKIQMHLSLEGIGAALRSEDGMTIIESLVPGGQAEKSGELLPKDKIIAVTQEKEEPVSVIDMALRDVVSMIRGKRGTKVTLTVLRDGPKPQTFDVTIVRDKIQIEDQAAKISYTTKTVDGRNVELAVIDLPSFYGGSEDGRSCSADTRKLLNEARKKKVDGVVLDLSRNGGGLLEEAVKIAGLFIHSGAVVATKDSQGGLEVLKDEDTGVEWTGPLVVLTSPASASAAEIVAGALKDYGRAVIAGGEQTFGKGSVQMLSPLANVGAIKVTTGMYFLPGGQSTQQRGVTPHVRIPSVLDASESGERTLDYSLAPENTASFLSVSANGQSQPGRWRSLDPALVAKLSEKSASRVAAEAVWKDVRGEIAEMKSKKGPVRLADVRKQAEDEKKQDAQTKESDKKEPAAAQQDVKADVKPDPSKPEAAKSETAARRDKFDTLLKAVTNEAVNVCADLVLLDGGKAGTGVRTADTDEGRRDSPR